MKKIGILKSSIIAVIILILATILYALCSKFIFKSNEENKSVSTLQTIEYSNDEQIEEDKIINVEISNDTIQEEQTKVFKIGVQQVQQIIIKEAERKAEKEEEKEKKDDKDKAEKNNKENESFKKIEGSTPYYIRVNYQANTVTVYTKDEKGKYTVPYKAMICSCGTWTPHSGTYALSYRSKWRALFGGVHGKYATDITGDILFHSVPYLSQKSDSLEYWEFDKLGTTASLGCVRLQVKDAKWIYDNCGWGTLVEFYASSNPGPLGKPSAPKISSNEKCRDWDPTDPEKGNPWNKDGNEKDDDKDKNTSSNKNNQTDKSNKVDKNNNIDKDNTTNKNNNETNKIEAPKKEETTNENNNNNINKQEPTEDKKEESVESEKTENEIPKQEENIPEQEKPEDKIPEERVPEEEPKEDIPEQTEPEENKPEEPNPSEDENKEELNNAA